LILLSENIIIGIGSLVSFVTTKSDYEPSDQHRNSLIPKVDDDDTTPVVYEDGEFKATKNTIKEMLISFRQLEDRYNGLKAGYEDYKRRYNLHKTMMWYWRKRAKTSEIAVNEKKMNNAVLPEPTETIMFYYEEHVKNVTDEDLLMNLTQQISDERQGKYYWKNKYTSLKLSKLRTCAKIGKEISPDGFSFSNCLDLLSNAFPDLNNISGTFSRPVVHISNHVNKAWNSLKSKWKTDTTFNNNKIKKDPAAIKKSLNVKRFRKMFTYGNIVADENLKQLSDPEIERFCEDKRYHDFTKRWRRDSNEKPCPPKRSSTVIPPSPCKKAKVDSTKERDTSTDKDIPNTFAQRQQQHIPQNMIVYLDDEEPDVYKKEKIDLREERSTPFEKDSNNKLLKPIEKDGPINFHPGYKHHPERILVYLDDEEVCKEEKIDLRKERDTPLKPTEKVTPNTFPPGKQLHQPQHIFVFLDDEEPILHKKEKVDLLKERGTPCDEDCVNDGLAEKLLREEKDKLQEKLEKLIIIFKLYKSNAKKQLKNAKAELKRKLDQNNKRRRERVRRLKIQKLELKARIRGLKEKQKNKHDENIRELEEANDELHKQIKSLQQEKRFWERIERHNMRTNLMELEESLERQQKSYEAKIKQLRAKFKKYVKQQKQKLEKQGDHEEAYHVMRIKNDRLQRKLDYYKNKNNHSQKQIEQLKSLMKDAVQSEKSRINKRKRKLQQREEKKNRNKRKLNKSRYGDSYDEEVNNLKIPLIPSVYCPDQMNCLKGSDGRFGDFDNHDDGEMRVPKAVKNNDEDIFMFSTSSQEKVRPPMKLSSPFFSLKPNHLMKKKLRSPPKPTPPKRLQEFEEEVINKRPNQTSRLNENEDSSLAEVEESELQSWYVDWTEHRADTRKDNDVYEEDGWYVEMMKTRREYRDEMDRVSAEERKYNWYFQSILDKEDDDQPIDRNNY